MSSAGSPSSHSAATTSQDQQVGEPPSYEEARIPLKPVTYQFSLLPDGAYILLPPSDSPDTRPLYHVRTFVSVFSPLARQTVVRRGGGDEGELVGEFEFGMSANKAYLSFHGDFYYLTQVLHKVNKLPGHVSHSTTHSQWSWSMAPVRMHWNCPYQSAWTCTLTGKSTVLAKYTQPEVTPRRGMVMPALQVTPAGRQYLDQILIAAIILEQKTTLSVFQDPTEYKQYFNF